MSNIIQFPAARHALVKLSVDALCALTESEFPDDYAVDGATGWLVVPGDDLERLTNYFTAHGLRLPSAADGESVYKLWRTLRLRYGQGVRLAAWGRKSEVQGLVNEHSTPPLSDDELQYCIAVGEQNLEKAKLLARRVFGGREYATFLY